MLWDCHSQRLWILIPTLRKSSQPARAKPVWLRHSHPIPKSSKRAMKWRKQRPQFAWQRQICYVPDVDAFARYSYQNNVPFLARNFGSFGVHFSYDLFDSGRKRSLLRERESQLSQAKENLARLSDEVELAVQTAYNKLERTDQMRKVSEELVALRTESSRVLHEQLVRGEALSSQADMGTAQELDARTLLLQSELDYSQANDEIIHAIGRTPE